MRRLLALLAALAALAAAPLAAADPVQFLVQQSDGQRWYPAVAPVSVWTGDRWSRMGYTDRYGRIWINLPRGNYRVMIQLREGSVSGTVAVTGTNSLRAVTLR